VSSRRVGNGRFAVAHADHENADVVHARFRVGKVAKCDFAHPTAASFPPPLAGRAGWRHRELCAPLIHRCPRGQRCPALAGHLSQALWRQLCVLVITRPSPSQGTFVRGRSPGLDQPTGAIGWGSAAVPALFCLPSPSPWPGNSAAAYKAGHVGQVGHVLWLVWKKSMRARELRRDLQHALYMP